jgi:hypothetical protein
VALKALAEPMRGLRWIGPVFFLAGLAGVLFAVFDPRPDQGDFERGVFYTVTRYDQALSLLGAGLAVARLPHRLYCLGIALFAAGVLSGDLLSAAIAAAVPQHPELIGYIFLIGPVCCVVAGASLAGPRGIRIWLAPLAAAMCGGALGMVMDFSGSTAPQWAYAGGAVVAGLLLVLAPLLVFRAFEQPWFPIPARIFGSWLIAIGAMLTTAQLFPRPAMPEPPAMELPAEIAPLGAPESETEANPLGLPDDVE